MRVLMISLDRGLLGKGHSGDVLARHQRYADAVGSIDVIVFAGSKFVEKQLSPNLRAIPTRSNKLTHLDRAYRLALELHRTNPYDLLVTQEFAAPVGVRLKKALNIPWVVSVHGMFFSRQWLGFSLVNWYLLYRIKRTIKSADGFRVNNEVIKQQLVDWRIEKPILVQPTAIDVSKFFVALEGAPLKEGHPLGILFVGRLSREKNLPMLINAVKEISLPLELHIVGGGPEEAGLRQLAASDERIQFLGPKKYEELPEIFATADIFALPSNTESFGQVLVQAAASGLAIITTDTTGAKGLIQNEENGLLVPVGDKEALKQAIERLLKDTDLRGRLGKSAQQTARKYDAIEATDRLIKFWQKIKQGSGLKSLTTDS